MPGDQSFPTATVTLKLFGAFRHYQTADPLRVRVPVGADMAAVKQAVSEALAERFPEFGDHALVQAAALATDDRVLPGDAVIDGDQTLAILPPVCGG